MAQLALPTGPDGVTLRLRLALTDVDASALIAAGARPPIGGRLTLQMDAEGSGLTPASLMGSLRGAGTVTLEGAQLAGLEPKAFDTVTASVDRGTTVDAAKIRDMMEAALNAGRLQAPRIDGAFSMIAGQARWGNVVVHGEGGDLTVTGTVDLSEWTLDARLTLSGGATDAATSGRPDVFVGLKGPIEASKRTLDVSALTGWLTLRVLDRQSKEIEALEAKRQEAERREAERREAERREAERREAERREAVRREAERREAERREAERREAERRDSEPRESPATERPETSVGSTAPRAAAPESDTSAQPARPAAPRRAAVPTEPADAAPGTSSPLELRPGQEQRPAQGTGPRATPGPAPNGTQKQRPGGPPRPTADVPPPAARRGVLDYLFGPQR
jgi:large subunit ribosomal protein L24